MSTRRQALTERRPRLADSTLTPDGSPAPFALIVAHWSKRFGDRVAFDDVSHEVGYGEVFGFLGPSAPHLCANGSIFIRSVRSRCAGDSRVSRQ